MAGSAAAAAARSWHIPRTAQHIINILNPEDGKVFIDMTFGGGRHTRALLSSNKSIKVIAIDRDPVAHKLAQELAAEIGIKSQRLNIEQSVIPILGKFSEVLNRIHLSGVPYDSVHGVMFDLGPSDVQMNDPSRGFSVSLDGPLDMRMNQSIETDITAEDAINNLSQEDLTTVLRVLGEERRSRKLANAIVDARTLMGRIRTTGDLARIISTTLSPYQGYIEQDMHPATRTFKAIRAFVNNELNELNYALEHIRKFLLLDDNQSESENTSGVATVLSYTQMEDTIVKRHFASADPNAPIKRWLSQHDRIRTEVSGMSDDVKVVHETKYWSPILKHVTKPSEEDIMTNPRNKFAKLRAARRIL